MQEIKTALLSYGMSGVVFHAPFISLHKGFELYAVLERTKNLAAAQYPGIITYRSLEALLGDPAIELVIVNTPNSTHYEFAKKALQAGKDVVVEKPFTINTQEADELEALARQTNRKLCLFHNRRWDSDFQTVQQVVQQGLLGDIVEAEIHYDRFKQELSYKQHKEIPGPGTGILYDLGSHLLDQALLLFGMPEAVFADLSILRPGSQVDDYMEILLFYPSLRVRLKGGYLVREAFPSFVLHGTKGSFLKPRADTQETRLQAGESPLASDWGIEPEEARGLLHTEINGEVVRKYIPTVAGNYMQYYELVYQCLRKDQPVPVAAWEGRRVIHIIEKAFESFEQKKVMPL